MALETQPTFAVPAPTVPGAADSDDAVHKAKNAFAGHRIDRNDLVPPFKAIASKYGDDKDAADKLAKAASASGRRCRCRRSPK